MAVIDIKTQQPLYTGPIYSHSVGP